MASRAASRNAAARPPSAPARPPASSARTLGGATDPPTRHRSSFAAGTTRSRASRQWRQPSICARRPASSPRRSSRTVPACRARALQLGFRCHQAFFGLLQLRIDSARRAALRLAAQPRLQAVERLPGCCRTARRTHGAGSLQESRASVSHAAVTGSRSRSSARAVSPAARARPSRSSSPTTRRCDPADIGGKPTSRATPPTRAAAYGAPSPHRSAVRVSDSSSFGREVAQQEVSVGPRSVRRSSAASSCSHASTASGITGSGSASRSAAVRIVSSSLAARVHAASRRRRMLVDVEAQLSLRAPRRSSSTRTHARALQASRSASIVVTASAATATENRGRAAPRIPDGGAQDRAGGGSRAASAGTVR